MNKLLAVAAVAVVAVCLTGCNRPWTSWLNRGAQCDTCEGVPAIDSFESSAPAVIAPEQLPLPGQG